MHTLMNSLTLASGLGDCVEDAGGMGNFSGYLQIRRELNYFMLNLSYSNRAEGAGQQIHYLFIALEHLDEVDKQVRITGLDEQVINTERIHRKIRSLKLLILEYIRQLAGEN